MLSENQLIERKLGIGGSDAAAVCGISKYKTPLQVYLDKISPDIIQHINPIFERGHDLEPFLFDLFVEKTGKNAQKLKKTIKHSKFPFMIANIDGFIRDERAILEIKTCHKFSKSEWGEPQTDQIPDDYFLQIQHYLTVCNYKKAYVFVLFAFEDKFKLLRDLIKSDHKLLLPVFLLDSDFVIYEINRSQEISDKLIEIEKEFWENNVLKKIPPNNQTLNDIKISFPSLISDSKITATKDIINKLNELKKAKDEKKEFNKKIDEKIDNLEFQILNFAQTYNFIETPTEGVIAKLSTINRLTIDSPRLKEELPDIYQSYLKKSTFRTLSINTNKGF